MKILRLINRFGAYLDITENDDGLAYYVGGSSSSFYLVNDNGINKIYDDGIWREVVIDFEAGRIEVLGVCETVAKSKMTFDKFRLYAEEKTHDGLSETLKPTISGTVLTYDDEDCFYSLTTNEVNNAKYLVFNYEIDDENLIRKTLTNIDLHRGIALKNTVNIKDSDNVTIGTQIYSGTGLSITSNNIEAIENLNEIANDNIAKNNLNGVYNFYYYGNLVSSIDRNILVNSKSTQVNATSDEAINQTLNVIRFSNSELIFGDDTITGVNDGGIYEHNFHQMFQLSSNVSGKYSTAFVGFYEEDGVFKKELKINQTTCTEDFVFAVLSILDTVFFDKYEDVLCVDDEGNEVTVYECAGSFFNEKVFQEKLYGKPFDKITFQHKDISPFMGFDVVKGCPSIVKGACGSVISNDLEDITEILNGVVNGEYTTNRVLRDIEIAFLLENGVSVINSSLFNYVANETVSTTQSKYENLSHLINAHTVNFLLTPYLPCSLGSGVTHVNVGNFELSYSESSSWENIILNGETRGVYRTYLVKESFKYPSTDSNANEFYSFLKEASNKPNSYASDDKDLMLRFSTLDDIVKRNAIWTNRSIANLLLLDTHNVTAGGLVTWESSTQTVGDVTDITTVIESEMVGYHWRRGSYGAHEVQSYLLDLYEDNKNVYFSLNNGNTILTGSPIAQIVFSQEKGYEITQDLSSLTSSVREKVTRHQTEIVYHWTGDDTDIADAGRTFIIETTTEQVDEVSYVPNAESEKPKTVDYTITKLDDGSIDIEWVNNSDIDAKFFTINNKKLYLEV